MRAAIFDEPGLTNLKVMDNVNKPQVNDHGVLCIRSDYMNSNI
jgi:hypothetical protein